jgi:hypothetical protein
MTCKLAFPLLLLYTNRSIKVGRRPPLFTYIANSPFINLQTNTLGTLYRPHRAAAATIYTACHCNAAATSLQTPLGTYLKMDTPAGQACHDGADRSPLVPTDA